MISSGFYPLQNSRLKLVIRIQVYMNEASILSLYNTATVLAEGNVHKLGSRVYEQDWVTLNVPGLNSTQAYKVTTNTHLYSVGPDPSLLDTSWTFAVGAPSCGKETYFNTLREESGIKCILTQVLFFFKPTSILIETPLYIVSNQRKVMKMYSTN